MKHSTEDTVDKFTEAIKNFPIDDLTRNSVIWIHKQAITSERTRCREEKKKVLITFCQQLIEACKNGHDCLGTVKANVKYLTTNTEVK